MSLWYASFQLKSWLVPLFNTLSKTHNMLPVYKHVEYMGIGFGADIAYLQK